MPDVMKKEVIECLETLEVPDEERTQTIDISRIKSCYLALAQKYHPDAVAADETVEDKETAVEKAQEHFIKVKAAFDRLVALNEQYNGGLLTDIQADLQAEKELEQRRKAMKELKAKMALAKQE